MRLEADHHVCYFPLNHKLEIIQLASTSLTLSFSLLDEINIMPTPHIYLIINRVRSIELTST